MKSSPSITTLFLNENPVPLQITRGTIPIREQRLRAALPQVKTIHILARPGNENLTRPNNSVTPLEAKMVVHHTLPWPYYGAGLPLFVYGFILILRYHPHVIEAESPILSGPAAILLGKLFHLPVIVEYRASYHHLIYYRLPWVPIWVKKLLLNLVFNWTVTHADFCVANSHHYADRLKQLGAHVVVINPGLYPVPSKAKTKTLKKHLTIGYLGRLVPEKGINVLIQAASVLKDRYHLHFTLEIAGIGPMESTLKTLVKKLKLNRSVKFVGYVDAYTVLKAWHILVNPNTVKHPLEMVNAEAAALGVPVVCFGSKTVPETVDHLQTGIVVNSPDADSLASAINHLATNPQLYRRLARNAPLFAHNNYSFASQMKQVKKLYQALKLI